MKAWEIIGWALEGSLYCADHRPVAGQGEESPVFASTELDPLDYCDTCLFEWMRTKKEGERAPFYVYLNPDLAQEALEGAKDEVEETDA